MAADYLAPPLLRAGVDLLRGYAGDVSPAAALSAVESEVRRGGAGREGGGPEGLPLLRLLLLRPPPLLPRALHLA